jgi:DNA-binding NtrC family response regulator
MKYDQVLIIDDEKRYRELLSRIINLDGFTVFQAENVREGLKILENKSIGVVITDVRLPGRSGFHLLEQVKKEYPLIEVIVITAYGTIQDGVNAMKQGAFDYISKGDNDDKIHVVIQQAADKVKLQAKLQHLEKRVNEQYGFENIIGESEVIQKAIEMARKVAPTNLSVLLQGGTGTGKELFAQAIHQASNRKDGPFVALNCSAFPREMLESELYGFKKGTFTGAIDSKKGLIEEADTGTLFLDEISEMAIGLQAKLLRFLESKKFTKLGETKERSVDLRIIAATNSNLEEEIAHKTFRDDLYFRLSGFQIDLPPLRERTGDIRLLANYFLKKLNEKTQQIDKEAMALLLAYPWPGNIRELKNTVERAVILATGKIITPELLPHRIQADISTYVNHASGSLKEVEQTHIKSVLQKVNGNKTKAAQILEISTSTLYRKIEEYDQ